MAKPKAKLPRTSREWQEAVDLAEGLLALDSARKYGLVEGGPDIDADRCEMILQLGKGRRITPSPDAVERVARAFG